MASPTESFSNELTEDNDQEKGADEDSTEQLLEGKGTEDEKAVRIYFPTQPEDTKIQMYKPAERSNTVVKPEVRQRQNMYLEKHKSQTRKYVCGMFTICVLFGVAVVMCYFAYTKDIFDLYIIGGIFGVGGLLFTIGFITVRCTVDRTYKQTDYSSLFR